MKDRFILTPFFLDEDLPELESLAGPGWQLNRPALPEATTQSRMSAVHRPLADLVAAAASAGDRPIAISGDCCAAIGMAGGLERAGIDPVLVWLDAHGDFNTWDTTPSGFLGGMPLAMLTGRGDPTLMDQVRRHPFPEDRVVLTDARDLDPGERTLLEASAVKHLPNPRTILTRAVPSGPIWVHFDVDVVDPNDVPAVAYPAPGGLPAAVLEEIFHELADRRQIVAISVSAWSPELDPDGRSRDVCLRLLQALTGRR